MADEPDNQEPTQPEAPDEASQGQTFTQADIDRIVQQRLTRERQQHEQQLAELKAQQEEARRAKEREELEKKEEFKRLYEETKAEKERSLAELEAKLAQQQQQVQHERIRVELLQAAQKADAIAPDHVVAILAGRVQVGEDGKPKVVDANGELATDGKGNPITLHGLVEGFIHDNPHFQRAAGGRGAQGRAGGSPAGDVGLDLERAKTDPEYYQQHRQQIHAMITAGKATI